MSHSQAGFDALVLLQPIFGVHLVVLEYHIAVRAELVVCAEHETLGDNAGDAEIGPHRNAQAVFVLVIIRADFAAEHRIVKRTAGRGSVVFRNLHVAGQLDGRSETQPGSRHIDDTELAVKTCA